MRIAFLLGIGLSLAWLGCGATAEAEAEVFQSQQGSVICSPDASITTDLEGTIMACLLAETYDDGDTICVAGNAVHLDLEGQITGCD